MNAVTPPKTQQKRTRIIGTNGRSMDHKNKAAKKKTIVKNNPDPVSDVYSAKSTISLEQSPRKITPDEIFSSMMATQYFWPSDTRFGSVVFDNVPDIILSIFLGLTNLYFPKERPTPLLAMVGF